MALYPHLDPLVMAMKPGAAATEFKSSVLPYLVDVWLDSYTYSDLSPEIIETTCAGFSYLFDIGPQRLISAWGISTGRNSEERDKSRMAGFPNSAGPLYHKGHAIAHTLGGGTDINLVPQLGRINVGAFRSLEKKAVATPGAFYFTYWIYAASTPFRRNQIQTPIGVDQGLLIPGQKPEITPHGN